MILLRNARLIDPASGRDEISALRVRDGLIAETGALEPLDDEQVIDLDGACLAPGLIDLRCWTKPGGSGRSGLEASARAAAAGGVTTLVLAPDSGSGLSAPEHFTAVEAAALTSAVRLLPAGLLVDACGEMGEIGLMLRSGAALIGDGGRPVADTRLLRRALSYASVFETWVGLRPEDAHLAADTVASESDLAMRLGLPARPAQSERIAVERAAALAELTGAKLLFDRVTTRDGLSALGAARKRGLELAASAPVTHLMFNEVDAGGFDARFRLEPPLRAEADREALIDALSQGLIDAVVSDHRACTGEAKGHPFPEAEPGSASLEALLPALCTLAQDGRMALIDALRAVTSGPADLLDLPQGRLEPGAPADLVAFKPDAPVVYGRDPLACAAPSAFEGRRLFGRVLITLVEGAIIAQPERGD